MQKFLIIDGNSLAFRAFYALPFLTNYEGTPTGGVFGFMNMFLKVVEECNPTHIAIAFDYGKKTFRNQIFAFFKIDKEIEMLKKERKKAKQKELILRCDNIIKTEEYGWVKLLPCGLGDTVYSYKLDFGADGYRGDIWTAISVSQRCLRERVEKHIAKPCDKIKVIIYALEMLPSYYSKINTSIFLNKKEINKDLIAYYYNFTEKGVDEFFEFIEEG